ncbi:hypothetical protein ParaKuw1_00048 [Paracoccus phage ParKuw1]|uniref:Uncharacterized protein n=1 Tax=Paracoccus phage ParKuw1 TaxID=3032415 RepID=A0AAF0FJC7_9CAUD|nr:hypothetical protein ParaKuw1_00048 [Paracoccus phage ParKuw1]
MTDATHYDTDHLSDDEIKAVASEVFKHYLAVMRGDADINDMLYADPEELADEYAFWMKAYEARLGYSPDCL